MKRLLGALGAAACLFAASPSEAASCGFTQIDMVAFGAYNPFSGMPATATGSMTYVCSLVNILDRVTLDLSAGASSSVLPWRTLMTGSHPLNYNLYLDAGLTQVWGDGSGSTFHFGPAILPILPNKVFVYGFIPGSQNAWAGMYTDTVVITMNF
jgi:spore coat protein U-like protein